MNKKFEHIELLRFFSALAVVITHYIHFYNPFFKGSHLEVYKNYLEFDNNVLPLFNFLEFAYRFGYTGVYFFWLISGFVLAYTYINKKRYQTPFRNFFINRFARLYPLHFLTLILVLILQLIIVNQTGSYQIIDNYLYVGENNFKNFFSQLFFVSGWLENSKFSFNFPIWSVSIEIVIYFLFFFAISTIYKFKFLLSLTIFLFFLFIEKSGIDLFFHSCGRYFFSGVLLFFVCDKIKKNYYILILALALCSLNLIGNFKYNLFFAAVVLFAYYLDKQTNYKVKTFYPNLGNLTYGSYLLHIPTQLFIILIMLKFNFNYEIFKSVYFFLFYLIIIFFLSHISFKFFENPMRILLRKSFNKKRL